MEVFKKCGWEKNAARLMLGQLPPPEARLLGLPKSLTALPVQRGPGDGPEGGGHVQLSPGKEENDPQGRVQTFHEAAAG